MILPPRRRIEAHVAADIAADKAAQPVPQAVAVQVPAVVKPVAPQVPSSVELAAQGFGGSTTMTSLEIAELTGKEHRNVMRDISAMLKELGGALSFERAYLHP